MHLPTQWFFLVFSVLTVSLYARPFVLLLPEDDLKNSPGDLSEWDDEFCCSDSHKSDEELDFGSWRPILERDSSPAGDTDPGSEADSVYYSGVSKMLKAVSSSGELSLMHEAVQEIEAAVAVGHPHAMSVLGFLHGSGHMRERNKAKAFMYHFFAADGGNMQSKMALAYTYLKQEMYDKSAQLYSQLAEAAVNSFLIAANSPVVEPVSIHNEGEENKEALRKFQGEEDEDFQVLKYQAEKGNAAAMYKIGLFYYFGLRGLRRDYAKALSFFFNAVEKGEPRSMELLGEMYASGTGVERNYTQAFKWLALASKQEVYSAYNGLGYLYLRGYGVEKNYSKAMDNFDKAANNEEAGAYYNLGVMFLKGIWVKRDVKLATKYFIIAANAGHIKAFYQLAKMFHSGVGLKKNLPTAVGLYKLVAEKGPWISLSTWAVKSYLKGDIGKAFFLYSRMAELGYEVAQSNAAWILDKYGEQSLCIGESGFCTVAERHQLAQSLWWHAYKQGNQYAAFLFAGTERDHDPAADAYTNTTKVADVCGCESMKELIYI